jgi:hypothetical protein
MRTLSQGRHRRKRVRGRSELIVDEFTLPYRAYVDIRARPGPIGTYTLLPEAFASGCLPPMKKPP